MQGLAFSAGEAASLACTLEATAPKPGNVHRGADFEDLTFQDMLVSALAIRGPFSRAEELPVGRLVFESIQAIHHCVGRNTYLGTVLLLAPLAKCGIVQSADGHVVCGGVADVLQALDRDDSENVYQAIRLAAPGGLGTASKFDIREPAPKELLSAMQLASEHDRIARQYVTNFHDVLECVIPDLQAALRSRSSISEALVQTHIATMARFPDSLIARKLGQSTAVEAQARARKVLESGPPFSEGFLRAAADLDFWLRADGHRRNPGTTADLVAAGLFILLRVGAVPMPLR